MQWPCFLLASVWRHRICSTMLLALSALPIHYSSSSRTCKYGTDDATVERQGCWVYSSSLRRLRSFCNSICDSICFIISFLINYSMGRISDAVGSCEGERGEQHYARRHGALQSSSSRWIPLRHCCFNSCFRVSHREMSGPLGPIYVMRPSCSRSRRSHCARRHGVFMSTCIR